MRTTCTGVYRSLGDDRGTCSLGRHCTALPVVNDHDAYRDAHARFSEASAPLAPAGDDEVGRPTRRDDALLDIISDAMARLDRLNPPRE
jgi:hypothetical protein